MREPTKGDAIAEILFDFVEALHEGEFTPQRGRELVEAATANIEVLLNAEDATIPPEYDDVPNIRYVDHVQVVGLSSHGFDGSVGVVAFSNDDDFSFAIEIPSDDLGEWRVNTRIQVVLLEAGDGS